MELRALCTLCDTKSPQVRGKLLMHLRETHFGTEATTEVFRKIKYTLEAGKDIPRFRDLPDLLNLSTEAETSLRTHINDPDGIQKITQNGIELALDKLHEAYQARVFADLHTDIGKILSKTDLHGDDGDERANKGLAKAESLLESAMASVRRRNVSTDMIHCGVDGDSSMADVVGDVIKGKQAKKRLKTGWEVFDKRTGGLDRGNVLVITAGTGGGKSVALNHMLTEMYKKYHYKVANVSLEMTHEEVVERALAMTSRSEVSSIHKGKLSRDEKKKIVSAFDELDKDVGSRYTIFTPSEDSTIQEIIEALAPYGYDCIGIDYLQLLKMVGPKGSNQEQMYSEAVRYAKRIAVKLDCVIVLLSQLNEDGQLRGSRAIGFHASFWWKLGGSSKDDQIASKERGFLTVEQPKARSGEQFDFYLTCDFAHMRMDTYYGPEANMKDDGESPQRVADPAKLVLASSNAPKKKIKMSLTDDGL